MTSDSNPKPSGSKTTRRDFIKTSAAVAAGVAATAPFRPSSGQILGANEQIGVGFIGVGGRGAGHMREVNAVRERYGIPTKIVAACDIYRPRVDEAVRVQNVPAAYMDYRELLDDPNVDVVAIASPDHHHGYHAIDAIKAGKDVYCEKPVTHWRQFEVTKKLADTVAESDRVFQLGTQGMCDSVWRQMKKLVRDGLIGQPIHGEAGFFRVGDWGERGMPVPDPNARPGPDLDWEQFLGDSPKREFTVDRFFRWRLFEDYAGGPVTDLLPHCVTQVIDVMGLGFPDEVVGIGSIDRYEYALRQVPDTFNLLAHYPEQVTIAVLGTSGNDHQTTPHRGSGQRCPVIRGWEGTLTIEAEEIVFTPAGGSKKEPRRFAIEHGEDLILYWKKLFDCVISRDRETWSPMDLAFRTQTMLQMAMLASRAGKTARFDAENREIII